MIAALAELINHREDRIMIVDTGAVEGRGMRPNGRCERRGDGRNLWRRSQNAADRPRRPAGRSGRARRGG
jgi:hypothetical protein